MYITRLPFFCVCLKNKMEPLNFEDFDISEETGFVPSTPPLDALPGYFKEWDELVAKIPSLVAKRKMREEILKLPVREFSSRTLTSDREWQRAYTVVTFLSQAYIWMDGEDGVPKRLPELLAGPWCATAEHVGVPPIVTYASAVLYNWRLRDPKGPMTVENLEALMNYTGTEDESWFYMLCIPIEIASLPGIKAILNSLSAMRAGNNLALSKQLDVVATSLRNMQVLLTRMYEGCDPKTFYVKVRPFQAGSKGLKAFPEGLIYEGVAEEPKQYSGASAAESSCVHCFDIFFKAQHKGEDDEFLQSMRLYMPVKHQQFLRELARQPSVHDYVKKSNDLELIKVFNKTIEAFANFRSEHVRLVTRYIVNQISHSVNRALDERGTGGTPFMIFLKNVRDDTIALKIEQ